MNKQELLNSNLLFDIDQIVADYFCQLGTAKDEIGNIGNYDEQTWVLMALTSFFTNLKNTAFDAKKWAGKTLADLPIEVDPEVADLIIPDFTQYDLASLSLLQQELLSYEFSCFYLRSFREDEEFVAQFIHEHSEVVDYNKESLKAQLNQVFENHSPDQTINYQKVAAFIALRSRFAVISGGPGTGKTTTVGKVLALLLSQNPELQIQLLAPTGKAADRLRESIEKFKLTANKQILGEVVDLIPSQTMTLHRFLQQHKNQEFASCDVLLIDEASMVPCTLFAQVFKKLQEECRVILLGDKDQLESIETGAVLTDLTSSDKMNYFSPHLAQEIADLTDQQLQVKINPKACPWQDSLVQLQFSHRFDAKSGVGQLSHLVNNMQTIDKEPLSYIFTSFKDQIQWMTHHTEVGKIITEIAKKMNGYRHAVLSRDLETAFNELTQFRVLCAVRKGELGVDYINTQLEELLFHQKRRFYYGKPIMITKNDYALGISNGDVGILWQESEDAPLFVYLKNENGNVRKINPLLLNDFYETAFALTIHKSQGSEFDHVCLILPDRMNPIMNKALLYTGITRAKSRCDIYDPAHLLPEAIVTSHLRTSNITKRLISPHFPIALYKRQLRKKQE